METIRDRTVHSPGDNNLMFHVENTTPQQLQAARHTIDDNPDVITIVDIVDRNGNTDSIKIE